MVSNPPPHRLSPIGLNPISMPLHAHRPIIVFHKSDTTSRRQEAVPNSNRQPVFILNKCHLVRVVALSDRQAPMVAIPRLPHPVVALVNIPASRGRRSVKASDMCQPPSRSFAK